MTVIEAQTHQRRVQQALQQAESLARRVLVHRFRGDDLDAAGVLFGGPPFLVMCSETFDASLGRYAPVREYPWGVAEALRHSDLTAVKRLIFEVQPSCSECNYCCCFDTVTSRFINPTLFPHYASPLCYPGGI